MSFRTYTPNQIKKLRKNLDLSTDEMGEALGLSDAGRIVRGWESGERNGRPTGPSGSALAALHYMLAIREFLGGLDENDNLFPENLIGPLRAALPDGLRSISLAATNIP